MYSKNDYRYYLENQLIHSNDFLAHYGVKGMKWHKKSSGYSDDRFNHTTTITTSGTWEMNGKTGTTKPTTRTFTTYGQNQKKKDMRADRRQLHKKVDAANPYKYDKKKSLKKNIKSNIKVAKDRKQLKEIADKTVDRYYNGKDTIKKKRPSVFSKDQWTRVKPKGKKLKGSKNIYVSHN